MRAVTLALVGVLAGCTQSPNTLSGSLSSILDLEFERTRARQYPSELSIEYLNVEEVVLRVTVADGSFQEQVVYVLAERGDVGTRDDVGFQLPELVGGELELSAYSVGEAEIEGSFDALLETVDGTQLLAFGSFESALELVLP